jgi:cell shape-determining protein MreD
MNRIVSMSLFVLAFLAVWLQATVSFPKRWLGAQIDLLPVLMVYAGLFAGPGSVATLAVLGGLTLDALSLNPLGASVLPLFAVGFGIQHFRDVVLRDTAYAQFMLGLAASAFVPAATVVLLLLLGQKPTLSWGSLWQWLVVAFSGAVLTPACSKFLQWLDHTFGYREMPQSSFRADREIVRPRR